MEFPNAVTEPSTLARSNPWTAVEKLEAPLEAIGFWVAIGFPVVYLSLLVSGIETRAGLGLFLGLVCLHVMALVVGRDYRRD